MIRRRGLAANIVWLVLVMLMPALDRVASAQTVDPTLAEFVASPDHSATLSDGTAAVTRYDLEFYNVGAASPFQVVSLGKPAPGAGGIISVQLTSVITSLPSPGIVYEARVAAVGPGGAGRSTPSNTFSFSSPPCSFSISPTTQSIVPAGGTGSVTVTAGPGCAWTATDNATWISITAGSSGSGNGTVNYSVTPDVTASARTGTLTIAGRTLTVTQSPCSFAVSPTTVSLSGGGGAGSVTLTATTGCPWTATSGATWLTVTGAGSGTGNATVSFSATSTATARSTTLTIAGRTVTVSQGATPAPPTNLRVTTP
ncbi:MAG TPA: BACON domain-containing protein [Gemmatimonadaceae bacterium]|nr:BACON domain-containing protein [Gemmatimonadaceae bacterium]